MRMAAMDRRNPPPSPCDSVCVVDRRRKWCLGCLRTLEELEMWEQMSPDEQWALMDELARRRETLDATGT